MLVVSGAGVGCAAHKATPHFAEWRTVAVEVLESQVNTAGELLYTHTSEESA
jgi:autoinducer 2-degrading protein